MKVLFACVLLYLVAGCVAVDPSSSSSPSPSLSPSPELEPACTFRMEKNGDHSPNVHPAIWGYEQGFADSNLPYHYYVGDCDYLHSDFYMRFDQNKTDKFIVKVYPMEGN